jgi:hypothetical protein
MKKFMILAIAMAAAGLTPASMQAQTKYRCNHDPVCQAKRDGVTVEQARQTDRKIATCARSAGVSADAWSRYAVPAGPKADKMRACMAS